MSCIPWLQRTTRPMKQIICDRCGRTVIPEELYLVQLPVLASKSTNPAFKCEKDFCKHCADIVETLITSQVPKAMQ